jgi:hypothetical protein
LTPQYTELLRELQKENSHNFFSQEVATIQNNLGKYVLVYDDERKIIRAFLLCLFGEEGIKEVNEEFELLTPEEQQASLNEMLSIDSNQLEELLSDCRIPQSSEEWKAAGEALAALPEDVRKETEKRGAFFWCFLFSSFFNTLSLMVHGIKMTTLVPRAFAGDDEAFFKAVQIDRMLLLHHPFFRDRKLRAQNEGDTEFLTKLAYRESNPPLRSKIQYPGLYMLFGILEYLRWLPDLRHEEILNICDEAELDRYQNRIEDVNYLTKRLIEYRRWQKTGGVSMH